MDSEFSKKEEVLKDLYSGDIEITPVLKCECKTIEDVRVGVKEFVPVAQTFTEELGKKTTCFVCHGPVGTNCYKLGNESDPRSLRYVHKTCLGCTQCNKVAASYIIDDADGSVRCGTCGLTCKVCGGSFVGGMCLIALGKKWHFGCLTCAQCQSPLSEKCIEYQGKAYCPDEKAICLRKHFGLICNACGLELEENYTRLAGKCFHKECVSCSRCHNPIFRLDFYPVNGHPYCDKCTKEYFNEI